ncbi:MAG: hypothetical protein ACYTFI_01195 [Planctomycetota bacterium]|jgi:hypothetical protein
MNWLKGAFTKNLLLKFSALVCAVVLWVYVDSFVYATKTIAVPLGSFAAGPHKTIVLRTPREVKLTVRGPRGVLERIGPDSAELYPSGRRSEGDLYYHIVLDEADFSLSDVSGVYVWEFEPRLLSVRRSVPRQ